ncbi:MAG: sugar phosphate nucleotidyltransferase [Vicinamibacterales bacterium]
MRALILTAGLGTRLRPLSDVRAKAAVPVNGEPMVRRVIAWLVREGLEDLVLNLHHRPASIAAVVGDGADLGARVRYSWESPVLGSAGGPRRALPLLIDSMRGGADADASTFLLVNGDTLTDFPLARLLDTHRSAGALVTMVLIRNPRPDLYGGVIVERGRVKGFTRRGATRENFHFIGVQAAEERAFSALEDGVPVESVGWLYPQLIEADATAVAAHVVDAPFSDVGTPADYLQTSMDLAATEGDRMVSRTGTAIHPTADVQRTAVWDHVTIGAHVTLRDCIVCDAVTIPEGSHYERCAIVKHDGRAPLADESVEGGLLIRSI